MQARNTSRCVGISLVVACACVTHTLARADTVAAENAAPLGLNDLYETALSQDPQLHAEIARLDALKEEYPIARAGLLPQIHLDLFRRQNEDQEIVGTFFRSGGGGGSNRTNYSSYTTQGYSLELSQTLFDLEKWTRLTRSEAIVSQTEIQAQDARQSLIIRLSEAYFAVLLANSELEFIVSEKNAVAKQLDDARARYRVGLSAQTDVKEAQAAFDLATADEIAALNRLNNSKHSLATIVGHDIDKLLLLSPDFPVVPPEPQDPEAWVMSARQSNFTLLSKQLDVAIALKEVKLQSAGHWPTLDLFAARDETDVDGGPSPNRSYNDIWGVRLRVPIFSGGETTYKTRQAALRHRQQLEELEREYRENRRSVTATYRNIMADIKRIKALTQARVSAQASWEAIEEGFRLGSRTSSDVLLALRDVFRSERDLAQARHEYVLNTLRLKLNVGILSPSDIQNLQPWLR